MTEAERIVYRRRLNEGDTVYWIDGRGDIDNPNWVSKGTVKATRDMHGIELSYPGISTWRDLNTEPSGSSQIGKSPRELFTIVEMKDLMKRTDFIDESRAIDEMVADPLSSRELALVMGTEVMHRMLEDISVSPRDPEM